jgi:hypothetical protein
VAKLYNPLYREELASVRNGGASWTDSLKNRVFAALRREKASEKSPQSVRKASGFVDRDESILPVPFPRISVKSKRPGV